MVMKSYSLIVIADPVVQYFKHGLKSWRREKAPRMTMFPSVAAVYWSATRRGVCGSLSRLKYGYARGFPQTDREQARLETRAEASGPLIREYPIACGQEMWE
ncbi:hypothetical protein JW905_12205, partial [bacterium]|nr:hypothetical protein [candidate division CSSED10-310 bacterium]